DGDAEAPPGQVDQAGAVHAERAHATPDVRDVAQAVGPGEHFGVVGGRGGWHGGDVVHDRPRRLEAAGYGHGKPAVVRGAERHDAGAEGDPRHGECSVGVVAQCGRGRGDDVPHAGAVLADLIAAVPGGDPYAGGVDAVEGGEVIGRKPAGVAA